MVFDEVHAGIGGAVAEIVGRELRSYGANISVRPAVDSLSVALGGLNYKPQAGGAFLNEADLVKLKQIFWRNNIVSFAPFLDVTATVNGQPGVAVVGSWFEKAVPFDKSEVFHTGLKQLHPAWKVQGLWPDEQRPAGCLIGRRLARTLGVGVGQPLRVSVERIVSSRQKAEGGKQDVLPTADGLRHTSLPMGGGGVTSVGLGVLGILETGGPEEGELFAPLELVQNLAGLAGKIRRIEVSALTKPEDAFAHSDVTKLSPGAFDRWFCTPYVSSIAYQIQQAMPGAEAKPIYQVAETEGKILKRIGFLLALLTIAALATAVLAVSSMMLAAVLERRVEIGLFKSLGATDARVAAIFLLEAFFIGLAGGVVGYLAGSFLAGWLSVLVFGRSSPIQWVMFPIALALALVVALVGSALPLGRGLKISPAVVLRNE